LISSSKSALLSTARQNLMIVSRSGRGRSISLASLETSREHGTKMPEQRIGRAEDREALVNFLERATK